MSRLLVLALLTSFATAQDPSLPPVKPFRGKSLELVVDASDPWITPCEKSGFRETPRYAETTLWLQRLCKAAPELKMVSLGRSDEGRDIWMVVASKDRAFTPESLRETGKPVLFAQAGIHAGEIDGKDAGMMLLRDMTVRGTRKALLDRAAFLFIPILSVDGHERFGPHGRINQRGPAHMGWRTNGRNLNLNRDYAKLDTAGVRAAVRVLTEWGPSLYYDIHVTDGADYQYDITWGYNGPHAYSPAAAAWMRDVLDPALQADLRSRGHVPGPLVFAVDSADMTKGNGAPTFGARYSNGYGDLRHQPTILVENHSLKPYDQRVLGTYVLLESTLRALGTHGAALKDAITKDRGSRKPQVPLTWKRTDKVRTVEFLAIGQRVDKSPVTGGKRIVWTGEPVTLQIPLLESNVPQKTAERPKAYWIPAAYKRVIHRLRRHGIRMEKKTGEVSLTFYRATSFELAKTPFEGRVRVSAEWTTERRTATFQEGSVRISTDQPLGDLAVVLLEPESPDSLLQWGFFLEIFQRTEYVENYVMDPLAERMLAGDPELKAAYEKRLAGDEAFAKDARARLQWFYKRTPYFDARWNLYPVGRE